MSSTNSNLLYVSHTLSTWNTRVFQFGSVLFLAELYPGTLFPVSFYALCSSLPGAFLGSKFGHYIDTHNRLEVVRWSILGQRFAVMAACLLLLYPLSNEYITLVLLAALGGFENSWSIINTVSVERDWVIVVAGSNMDTLRRLNSTMRFIDLSCKLLGPFLVGVVDGMNNRIAVAMVLGLSALSVSIEYFAIARVYHSVSALSVRQEPDSDDTEAQPLTTNARPFSYWRHPLLLFSLAYTLSYITVLSFGGQMITFLLACGMSPDILTFFRTGSVVVELCATLLAPLLITRVGPYKAGALFIDFEAAVLLITSARFIILGKNATAAIVLALGVAISRVGLWGFDLSTQIVIQDGVKESERGKFSAVEKSLQNWAQILVYCSTMVFSRPDQFKWPMALSVAAVCGAAITFNIAMFNRKRTLSRQENPMS